jgi:S-(hydroxymethyl)glutathione dehydrogenase/alcohol dehydrogenase
MKAVTFQGIKNVKVKEVPSPTIQKPYDIIVRVTSTAICGSDLHLIHDMVPNIAQNYIIGHEPMGIVEEIGPAVTKLKKGYYHAYDLQGQYKVDMQMADTALNLTGGNSK